MALIDGVNSIVDAEMEKRGVENTLENRIVFLELLYQAWIDLAEHSETTSADEQIGTAITAEIFTLVLRANQEKHEKTVLGILEKNIHDAADQYFLAEPMSDEEDRWFRVWGICIEMKLDEEAK